MYTCVICVYTYVHLCDLCVYVYIPLCDLCVCACVQLCARYKTLVEVKGQYMEKSGRSLHHVVPGDQIQIVRPDSKWLYLLSRLTSPKALKT